MNAYKELEKINNFQLQELKRILDELPLFEIVERKDNALVVRQEAKNCISMKELIGSWEMVKEKDDLIYFVKVKEEQKEYDSRFL